MPQMMPLNWILLYMFFIWIFINFIMINYFTLNNKIFNMKSIKTSPSNLNWKW